MGRRLAGWAWAVPAALVLGVAGVAAAAEGPVFRGFERAPAETVAAYSLSVTRQTSLDGQVLRLPGLGADFRLVTHAPDGEGRRLVELVYTRLAVEGDPGGMAEVFQTVVDRPFRVVLDRAGNLAEYEPPAGLRLPGFDVRQMFQGPLVTGGAPLALRPGDKVTVKDRSEATVEGIDLVTETETTLEYAGRETRDGREHDLLLLSIESRSGLASGAPHYTTQTQGRLYADPSTGTLAGMVLETVVTPPEDAPGLPLSATRVEVRLESLQPLFP